jgi:hypothetical protein
MGALDASYVLVSSPRVGVVVAAQLFAGALRDGGMYPMKLFPRGGAASIGLRWP